MSNEELAFLSYGKSPKDQKQDSSYSFDLNISSKNSNIFSSEEELIDCVYNQFELPFTNKNYYQNIDDILYLMNLIY